MSDIVDLLSCPNCGEPITYGKFCNLTCRRELLENNQKRAERRVRIQTLLRKFIVEQPMGDLVEFGD